MNRRRFLSLLGLAAVTAAVDPDALLWQPGKTTHILPPAGGWKLTAPPGLAFHRDAFSFISTGPNEGDWLNGAFDEDDIKAAAKALADRIDAAAMRLYAQAARDADTGISIRFVKQWDRDRMPIRFDILYGTIRPSLACRIEG